MSAFDRPSVVSVEKAISIAKWIAQGCRELLIPKVMVSFHGGEPMMLKPRNFGAICEALRAHISPVADLSFSIQTNGTILNDEWLTLFQKYSVHVGVSIDGDRKAHDRFRLDRRGNSTFDKIESNLKRLVDWTGADKKFGPSTISVLDWRNDYGEVYKYLRSLGIERMSFLLPDRNVDDGFLEGEGTSLKYGEALYNIFEAWLTEDNPKVYVRYIYETLQHFQLVSEDVNKPPLENRNSFSSSGRKRAYQIIVVQSDGHVAINDSYIPALSWYSKAPKYSISDSSLRDFLRDNIFIELDKIGSSLSVECRSCEWKRMCKGGDIENRFSQKNGFDNPSIYCDGYKFFYQGVCDLLVDNGYPSEILQKCLAGTPPRSVSKILSEN